MALLYINEYRELGRGMGSNVLHLPHEPSLVEQTPVDFTSGEAKSAAFNDHTRYVLITADADCHILFGTNPTATTSNKPVWAKMYQGYCVTKTAGMKISVIGA